MSLLRPLFLPLFAAHRIHFLVVHALLAGPVFAATATLTPSKDTTIYGNGSANLSNGAGRYLFAGSSGSDRVLRGLIAFDLAGEIPAGATINAATLTLAVTTPIAVNANTVRLHRVLADWGEGTSIAPMGEGVGAPATPGSATWNARISGTASWSTPGGDFSATVSASQPVSGSAGNAVFSGAGLVADVQAWVNNPASSFGWILVAQDETGPAVRFASRQGGPAPSLVIEYTTGGGAGGNVAPAITAQPASQTVNVGGTVALSVSATGTPPPAFQWSKDGAVLPGATNATLTLTGVTLAQAGSYTVAATNVAGAVTSAAAVVTVSPAPTGPNTTRLSNLSVRAAMAADQALIVGFSVGGGGRPILVRGVGPTLGGLGLEGTMVDPRLEMFNDAARVAENDDWGNSAALTAAFSGVGAFPFLPGSRDAAFLQTVDGTRSVHLKGTGAGVALVELYDTGSSGTARLVNVSARNQVGTGDNILIFGFFVDGEGTKNVLIRAIGPRLIDLGVDGALADPRFDVLRAGAASPVAGNDNWDSALAATFTAVGAFGLTPNSRDAALVTSLGPGSYTVQVSGGNGATGEALVEIYEVP